MQWFFWGKFSQLAKKKMEATKCTNLFLEKMSLSHHISREKS
jgi:hypothetical protein